MSASSTTPRPSARQRGYSPAWEKARAGYLAKHPLCVYCQRQGKATLATDVDHIVPHRGDMKIFWDRSNWQPLCSTHHKAKSASEGHSYKTGKPVQMKGADERGWPLDPAHDWRKPR